MKRRLPLVSAAVLTGLAVLRARNRKSSPEVKVPGRSKDAASRALNAGARLLQTHSPLRAMNSYLDGFHFYADDMGRQMEAHHYCARINEDFTQCAIFDGNTVDARLIGLEYIISERLFQTLPEEEKPLWHSHHYEVKSGTLVAPGLPLPVEHELMKKIVTTYGKTWHTWPHEGELPLGVPALMMGFTEDGQLDLRLQAERDARLGVSTDTRKQNRGDIPTPEVAAGANAWESGRSVQLKSEETTMRWRKAAS